MPQITKEIEHLYTFLNFKDDNANREIEKLGFSGMDDFKILEDEDVDMLVGLTPTQRRRLKMIIKFLKTNDIDSTTTFEKIRKHVHANRKEIQLHNINLPRYDGTNQEWNKWRNKVECIIRQHGMSDLLDDRDFAEAQPRSNKAFYAMLYLAVEDTPALSCVGNVPNRNGFQAWHALCALDNNGHEKKQDGIHENGSMAKSKNDVENINACIDFPEHINNRLSKKIKNRLAELKKEILVELNGSKISNEGEDNSKSNGAKFTGINETSSTSLPPGESVSDTKQNDREHNANKKSNENTQDMKEMEIDMDQEDYSKNDTYYQNKRQNMDESGFEQVDDETLSSNDESHNDVKKNHSRKRSRVSKENDVSTPPQNNRKSSEVDENTPNNSSSITENQNGPSHKSSSNKSKETNLKHALIPTKDKKSKRIELLQRKPDGNIDEDKKSKRIELLQRKPDDNIDGISSLERQIKIEAKDDDVLFNLSHTSNETHPGNYRLKRLILDNPEDTAEIMCLRYQLLYPSSRFLERDVSGWELMSKEKVVNIISSRLRYGYRGNDLTCTPSKEVETLDLTFDICVNDVFIHRVSKYDYDVPTGLHYRNIIDTRREENLLTTPKKVNEIANDIVYDITFLDPPGSFYIKNDEGNSSWEKMSKKKTAEITSHFLLHGFKKNTEAIIIDESDNHIKKKSGISLEENDVIPFRFKPGHPGTAYYYELFDEGINYAKVDTFASVALGIFDGIKSQNPPGRFLKYVGKGEWDEQTDPAALKKIQNELSNRYKSRRRKTVS